MLKLKKRNYIFISLLSFLLFLLSTEELTPYQQEAKLYRNRGLEFQRQGRLDEAMACL